MRWLVFLGSLWSCSSVGKRRMQCHERDMRMWLVGEIPEQQEESTNYNSRKTIRVENTLILLENDGKP